jgi:hypothetical protein
VTDDDNLRALVRDAVARHLGRSSSDPTGLPLASTCVIPLRLQAHPSHYRYALPSGEDEGGPCLIEPSVRCNHCGYCQSHGH